MRKLMYIIVSVVFFITTLYQACCPVFAAVQSQITRNQVEQRVLSMINLKWAYSKARNSNIDWKSAPFVTLPDQFKGITTAQVTGIPYDWGGMDGLDYNSYNEPWTNFLDAVQKGAVTGNTNSKRSEHAPNTAGIDCSGFVQAAYNIRVNKLSSSALLSTYFKKIDLSKIKHMDILDYPGLHVVIFDRWGSLNGIEGAYTYESTANQIHGGIQGTKKYFISKTTINKGYIPARYINVIDDAPLPSSVQKNKYATVKNVTQLNIRKSPSTKAPILGVLKQTQYARVLGYSSDGKWIKISINNLQGFAYAQFLSYKY